MQDSCKMNLLQLIKSAFSSWMLANSLPYSIFIALKKIFFGTMFIFVEHKIVNNWSLSLTEPCHKNSVTNTSFFCCVLQSSEISTCTFTYPVEQSEWISLEQNAIQNLWRSTCSEKVELMKSGTLWLDSRFQIVLNKVIRISQCLWEFWSHLSKQCYRV